MKHPTTIEAVDAQRMMFSYLRDTTEGPKERMTGFSVLSVGISL